MTTEITIELRNTVYASLFAALIAAGAFIAIPIGPVPVVLQNMFVLMTGLLLGWKWGIASVLVYLLAGIIGFPVFSAGRGGLAHFLGPTGGYLVGYIPAVLITGFLPALINVQAIGRSRKGIINMVEMVVGSVLIYGIGVPWLKVVTGMSWGKAAAVGVLPFLVGDTVKIIAGAYIAELIRQAIKK